MKEWKKELHIYKITPAPPKMTLQEYIEHYVAERDEKYFAWFLHAYENTLNDKIMGIVQEYAMYGHFEDLKAQYVLGMHAALSRYDPAKGASFLAFKGWYAKKAVDRYIRTMRTGYSVQSDDEYLALRKAMAMFRDLGSKTDDATLKKIAKAVGRKKDTVLEMIQSGVMNMHIVPLYHIYKEEDEEESLEIMFPSYVSQTEHLFMKVERYEAVRAAFQELTSREREIVAAHLGFCPDCISNWLAGADEKYYKFPKRMFIDIAADHMLSSPGSAERIYKDALAKMRITLEGNMFF